MSVNLQNTFKVHVNHRPVTEPFRPPTFVPNSIKSAPKLFQNTFKMHVNHWPMIEPFRPPTFVPISIKSFPKLCLKVGWMWILVKNGQLWPNFGSTRSRRNRWKSPETNELDRVLSLHTRFCYDPSSGYKVAAVRSETQIEENLRFVTPNPGSVKT